MKNPHLVTFGGSFALLIGSVLISAFLPEWNQYNIAGLVRYMGMGILATSILTALFELFIRVKDLEEKLKENKSGN